MYALILARRRRLGSKMTRGAGNTDEDELLTRFEQRA
jgi:hypothetical protein